MQYQDFVESYATKRNEELLRLSLDSENLTPEASAALTSELVKRGINSAEQRNSFREQEEQRKRQEARNPGQLFLVGHFGIGRWRFGKADYSYDPATGIEKFRTTVFVLLLYLPLIPTGSYLVQRKRGSFRSKMTILEKLPLDWGQVFRVWAVVLAGLVGLIWLATHL
jgi:hypothetical protein